MTPDAVCFACGASIFVKIAHPVTGEPLRLYPTPTTRFARIMVKVAPTAEMPEPEWSVSTGVPFCAGCAPEIGTPGPPLTSDMEPLEVGTIVAYETAQARHPYVYSEKYGAFLRAWLVDELHMEEGQAAEVVAAWEAGRHV